MEHAAIGPNSDSSRTSQRESGADMANEIASQGTHPIKPARWTWRQLLIVVGLLSWFVSVAVHTGVMAVLVALGNVALLMGALVIVIIPTRTVTVVELLAPFSLGGAMIGWTLLSNWGFDLAFGTKASAGRALGEPLVEEVLKIAPVLWILWRQRRRRTWTFGVTDVLLLAAASGGGFDFMETAFIIHNRHSWDFVGWFPTTDIFGAHMIASHTIWSAIAGLTIGIALLLRGPRLRMLLIAAPGWAWSVLDHAANNYGVNFQDWFTRLLRFVTADGHLSLYIFLLGVGCALVLDSYFAYFGRAKMKLPPFPASSSEAKAAWRYLRLARQLAYTGAHYQRTRGPARARLALLAVALGTTLRSRYPRKAAANPAAA